jgi:hypothetical protein
LVDETGVPGCCVEYKQAKMLTFILHVHLLTDLDSVINGLATIQSQFDRQLLPLYRYDGDALIF